MRMTAEQKLAARLTGRQDRVEQARHDFDNRLIIGRLCAYRLDDWNYVLEEETGERTAPGKRFGYYPTLAYAVEAMRERLTAQRDLRGVDAVLTAVREAREEVAKAAARLEAGKPKQLTF